MRPTPLPHRDRLLALNRNLVERFKRHFVLGGFATNECWAWTGAANGHLDEPSYGRFGVQLDARYSRPIASRISYVIQYGAIADDRDAMHLCCNPRCVNPTHLVAGTRQQNIADRDHVRRMLAPLGGQLDVLGPVENRWLIPHGLLWEGWNLPQYNDVVRARLDEAARAVREDE